MNKHWLMNHSRLTRFSDQQFMSQSMGGSGGGGGGVSEPPPSASDTGGANNTGGNNTGTGEGTGGTQNNGGTGFDPSKFWADPSGQNSSSGSGGGTNGGASQEDAGKEFATRLQNLTFGDVFTPDIAEQIGKGDLAGANKSFSEQLRSATQHSVVMAAQLMQKNNEAIMAKVDAAIEAKLGGRDNDATLEQHFPAAKDPAMRPMIQGVFNQALKLAKGNREEAVKSTREMLRYFGTNGANDMGITTPPSSQGDNFSTAGTQSLIDDLLGRR